MAAISGKTFPYLEFLPNPVFFRPPVNGIFQVDGSATQRAATIRGGPKLSQDSSRLRQVHWSKTRAVTWVVLIIWFVFSLVLPWFAKELNAFSFLGFELGYYFVVQGSLIVFVLLILVQNIIQDSIDDEYGSGNR